MKIAYRGVSVVSVVSVFLRVLKWGTLGDVHTSFSNEKTKNHLACLLFWYPQDFYFVYRGYPREGASFSTEKMNFWYHPNLCALDVCLGQKTIHMNV